MTPQYPTEEELDTIRTWMADDLHGLMEYVSPMWGYKEFGWKQEGDIYWLSTGGWSGNESLISAMRANHLWWTFFAARWQRGGHYIFAPATFAVIERLGILPEIRKITDV